jgi:hypothetical protein
MPLPNGLYRTKAGSTLEISGPHAGIFRLSFNWIEEPGACLDCKPSPEPEEWCAGDWRITWSCGYHQSGSARLFPFNQEPRL